MALMTYAEWRAYKEMVMGEMPGWFNDPVECRRRFEGYRAAFEGNCTEANPMDAALARRVPVIQPHIPAQAAARAAVPQSLWAVAVALILQLAVLVGPAFADSDIVVNGKTLSPQARATLEGIVGPLPAGSYWARGDGEFGRMGDEMPITNLNLHFHQHMQAAQAERQLRQLALRQQMMEEMIKDALRRRQAMYGHSYGGQFSSGQRYGNGSWSHYDGHSGYGVGGTANGCIYTPDWSNC